MASETPTIHATAVLIGPKAALIRGPAGAGKSRLAFDVLQAAEHGALPFARLVADDRVYVEARAFGLLVRPAPALAGLIEIHGLGIRRMDFEPMAAVGLVIDLSAADAGRHPALSATRTEVEGVSLPRLAVAPGMPALPLVLAFLKLPPSGD
jgi:HPr kinase/phosphorylase